MRRVRMFFCGVVCGVAIFSLLCIFSVPMANAQSLEFYGEAKVKASLVDTLTAAKGNEGAKFFVRIETYRVRSACGGWEYAIWEVGDDCELNNYIGSVDTCNARETTAWGWLEFENVRKQGETIICYFNGVAANKQLKSLGGYCWAEAEGVFFDTLISSKFKFQAKEKNIAKKLGCTPK